MARKANRECRHFYFQGDNTRTQRAGEKVYFVDVLNRFRTLNNLSGRLSKRRIATGHDYDACTVFIYYYFKNAHARFSRTSVSNTCTPLYKPTIGLVSIPLLLCPCRPSTCHNSVNDSFGAAEWAETFSWKYQITPVRIRKHVLVRCGVVKLTPARSHTSNSRRQGECSYLGDKHSHSASPISGLCVSQYATRCIRDSKSYKRTDLIQSCESRSSVHLFQEVWKSFPNLNFHAKTDFSRMGVTDSAFPDGRAESAYPFLLSLLE